MYEVLIAHLRECEKLDASNNTYIEAADAIAELSRENKSLAKSVNEASEILRKRWTPVEERLPEKKTQVLVYSGNFAPFMEVAFYDGLWFSAWDGETEIVDVTHWMPLPEPPEEE